jgi:hypothetical protein
MSIHKLPGRFNGSGIVRVVMQKFESGEVPRDADDIGAIIWHETAPFGSGGSATLAVTDGCRGWGGLVRSVRHKRKWSAPLVDSAWLLCDSIILPQGDSVALHWCEKGLPDFYVQRVFSWGSAPCPKALRLLSSAAVKLASP